MVSVTGPVTPFEPLLFQHSTGNASTAHPARLVPVCKKQQAVSHLKPGKEKRCRLTMHFRRSRLPVSSVIQVIVFGDTGVT